MLRFYVFFKITWYLIKVPFRILRGVLRLVVLSVAALRPKRAAVPR